MKIVRTPALATIFVIFLTGAALAMPKSQSEKKESAALFKQHCAMCHGQDARANTPIGKSMKIPDLHSPAVQQKTDAELKEVIDNGKNKMPAFKSKLKPEQVTDLVSYIRDLAKSGTAKKK